MSLRLGQGVAFQCTSDDFFLIGPNDGPDIQQHDEAEKHADHDFTAGDPFELTAARNVIGDSADGCQPRRVPEQEESPGKNNLSVGFGGSFLSHLGHGLNLNEVEKIQQANPQDSKQYVKKFNNPH